MVVAKSGQSRGIQEPSMTRLMSFAVATLALAASVGCIPIGPACTLEARASLNVTVVDDNGVPVDDAVVTAALEGGETKTCESTGESAYLCDFFEVEGTFVVNAARGEASDSATVDVGADECHVIAEDVELVLPAAT
jgi:hypothetical protein